jgi:hypothetical protein
MPQPVRRRLRIELDRAARERRGGGFDRAWSSLEDAHVLSQPWALDHVSVHATMIRRAWHEHDRVEIRGQLIRLLVAGPGSFLTRYPVGNTGRARVPATTPMPITDDDIVDMLGAAGQPTQPTPR